MTQLHPTLITDQAQSIADRWTAAVTRLAETNPLIAADCLQTMERIAGNVELYAIESVMDEEATTWPS